MTLFPSSHFLYTLFSSTPDYPPLPRFSLLTEGKMFFLIVHMFGEVIFYSYVFDTLKLGFQPIATLFR
ncbi:hypothetical protein MNBD_GAMMA24-917, partial [hydrothermal vent metagenome]